MHRGIQQSRKPVLVSIPHFSLLLVYLQDILLSRLLVPREIVHLIGCICLAFLQCVQNDKEAGSVGAAGAGAGYRVCIPFPGAAWWPDPDFLAATSSASAAPSKGSHGNYISDSSKVDFSSKMR